MHRTFLTHNREWNAASIYAEVGKVIAEKWSNVKPSEVKIPQIDLYKIWHYDNKNKRTSLKWLEFAMRWENVQDLPYAVGSFLTQQEMDHTIDYCYNDIDATEAFYERSEKHIALREFYTDLEKINLINASEIKMSKEIFAKHLSKEMGMKPWVLKQLRTYRSKVNIDHVVFDYIKFNDPINQESLSTFRSKTWINPENANDASFFIKEAIAKKNSFAFSTEYKNVKRDYGEGGLHSFGRPGIYESTETHVLVDVDFASFYPHISFKNNLHPEHIPPEVFNKLYEGFYHERKKYPKSDPRNYVLKIILNGSYGLSKDMYSFLYDPRWQLEICINGQLLLTKLTELVYEQCKEEPKIIFENTDGAMYLVKREDVDNIHKACKIMEELCSIPLEVQECKKIIARDVNNYINIINDDDIKFKGAFEIDRDYHKNHSKRIVAISLANYYIHGNDPLETIKNHLNKSNYTFADNHGIYDFCIGSKMTGQNRLFKRYIDQFNTVDEQLHKMNRYYVSNEGYELIKKLPPLEKNKLTETDKQKLKDPGQIDIFSIVEDVKIDPKDRETNIESGWKCKLFNKKTEGPYDINIEYYINEVNKIIKVIENE